MTRFPPEPCHFAFPDRPPLPWPLGLSVLEDACVDALQAPRPPSSPAAELPAPIRAFLDEARRRAALLTGRDAADLSGPIPFAGTSLRATILAAYRPGPCPGDSRRVDHASLRPLPSDGWITVRRCGAWKDDRIRRVFDERFGPGRWRAAYTWGALSLDERSGIHIYENGYRAALLREPELLGWLRGFGEVYDTAPSNVAAGYDYGYQEVAGAAQHWQDVALRRCLRRLGLWFQGEDMLEVRGRESEGYRLNPGQLDFHRPECLAAPRQYSWWRPGSIEDFSVSNLAIQTRLDDARAWLADQEPGQESCEALLHARHPALLPIAARFAASPGARVLLFLARMLSLTPEPEALPDPLGPAARLAERIAALDKAATIDQLLSENALSRRDALRTLESEGHPLRRECLEALAEDPARKLRNRARHLLRKA